ncbi:hypothetical protein EUGRSUZ_J01638 [Eucalyptus grandis]|uniref:Uncharacterized protein n=2 Tax=Eucalyptus grandis TaxID=71139 RepID=A0A059AEY1_EUCGR|nr:hypothetical protein EUGRSUZ_J01638 [Eucalyptus grandis]
MVEALLFFIIIGHFISFITLAFTLKRRYVEFNNLKYMLDKQCKLELPKMAPDHGCLYCTWVIMAVIYVLLLSALMIILSIFWSCDHLRRAMAPNLGHN